MDETPLLRRLYDLAEPQAGCISVTQLDEAGIQHDTVLSLVRRGAISRVMTGVYVVGATSLSDRQAIWAGLLVAGPDSVASHFTAAALHGLLEHTPDDVWITAPSRRHSRTIETLLPVASTGKPATIRVIACEPSTDAVLVDGLSARGAAGTLVDIAGRTIPTTPATPRSGKRREATRRRSLPDGRHIHRWEFVRAWKEADYLNLLRTASIQAECGRGVSGSALVRQVMATYPIVSDDNTDLATRPEFKLLAAVLRLGLPRPLTNQELRLPGATYFPDQYYRAQGVVVEADGGVHRRPARRAADRARDEHMRANGLTVLRFWNEEIEADADACALKVAAVVMGQAWDWLE